MAKGQDYCHNPECRDSVERRPLDPRPMQCTGETASAWAFLCQTCGGRAVKTKNYAGGTWGAGKTDDMRGKGLRRYTQGITINR